MHVLEGIYNNYPGALVGGTPKGPASATSMFGGYLSRNNDGVMKFKSSQIKKSGAA